MSFLDLFFDKKKKEAEELEALANLNSKNNSNYGDCRLDSFEDEPYVEQFKGQTHVMPYIEATIMAAMKKRSCPGHFLIYGPYGVGKSLLAKAIAKSIGGGRYREFLGAFLSNKSSFDAVEDFLARGTMFKRVLLIDEIHAMGKRVQEMLYGPLQDFKIDGKDIGKFTCIGITTDPGVLLPPMRSRFVHQIQLKLYTELEIEEIIKYKFIDHEDEVITFIAQRSKGCARHAFSLANAIQDAMIVDNEEFANLRHAEFVAQSLGITKNGLTRTDIAVLVHLFKAGKGSISKNVLASLAGISPVDLEFMYEPYLLKMGLISISSRGRQITLEGREYLHENKKHFIEMNIEQATEIK